jgi:hypothetical protein
MNNNLYNKQTTVCSIRGQYLDNNLICALVNNNIKNNEFKF